MAAQLSWETPLGLVTASGEAGKLTGLYFLEQGTDPLSEEQALDKATADVLALTRLQLSEYFAGTRRQFSVPLGLSGTIFQQTVWQMLQLIPYGQTRSYQEQAKVMGKSLAIRAIAAANGQNPIAVLVPCHRVLGAGGKLTGYRGGLWRKQALLDLERPGLFG